MDKKPKRKSSFKYSMDHIESIVYSPKAKLLEINYKNGVRSRHLWITLKLFKQYISSFK